MNTSPQHLLRPGPIFVALWLIGYLLWAFLIPGEWDLAIRQFLLKNRLGLEIYNSLGIHPNLAVSLLETVLALALAAAVTLAIWLAGMRRSHLRG